MADRGHSSDLAADGPEDLSDVELLRIEMETLWDKDEVGRIHGSHHLVIGAATSGNTMAIGADVPDAVADELASLVSGEAKSSVPGEPPASVLRCLALFQNALGAVEISSGPSYLIPGDISFRTTADIVRSDYAKTDALRGANPGNWGDAEWNELLDGQLGPWAMATRKKQVIAICHTPVYTDRGAEAGAWTHPDFRGQGYAAAVTAQWATLIASSGRRLFYSTSAANRSSQRVAERLNLRPIGWLWKFSRP